MNYSEKLKDPRWQKKRLEVFERDKWTCQSCGGNVSTLNIHHRRYQSGRDPWEYPNGDLVTLCEYCHERERDLRPQLEQMILDVFRSTCLVKDLINIEVALFEPGTLTDLCEAGRKAISKIGDK